MKEHPIIFSTDMVKAILDGRKTMTRRVITPQPHKSWDEEPYLIEASGQWCFHGHDGWGYKRCPYGQVGDRLWVRETVYETILGDWKYKADNSEMKEGDIRKAEYFDSDDMSPRPSIFMPRWASRILLEITELRVERLQDISDKDCIAEGCPSVLVTLATVPMQGWFHQLWNSLNAKWKRVYNRELKIYEFWQFPWCAEDAKPIPKTTKHPERYHCIPNPWVWVIGFKKADNEKDTH